MQLYDFRQSHDPEKPCDLKKLYDLGELYDPLGSTVLGSWMTSRGCVMLKETSFQKPDLEERLQTVKCSQVLEVANLHLS